MQQQSKGGGRLLALATVAALAAIAVGALFLIAPIWQPGAKVAEYTPQNPAQPPAGEPESGEANGEAAGDNNTQPTPPPALLNVNTATAEELTALPGVGAAKAAAIVAWRQQNGPFATLETMEAVDGISARMVAQWQTLATVGTQTPETAN